MTVPTKSHSVRCANNKRTRVRLFLAQFASCPKEQDSTWDTSLGFCTNLPGLIRSFAETGEDLHLHFDIAKRVSEAAVESAIARFQRTGSARRWDGAFFTTWPTPSTGTLAKVDRKKAERSCYRRSCARHSKPKRRLTLRVTRTERCESIFLRLQEVTWRRYYHLSWKKFTSRDIWKKRKTKTTKPRQHGLFQSGKNGSSSDNTVTWDIRSQRSLLVRYGTEEQGGKLFGLVLKELRCPTCEVRPLHAATTSRNVSTLLAF